MLIKFKSKASSDVIMLGESGKAMLRLLDKDAAESKGIFTVDQLPAAIATLKQAIAADKALRIKWSNRWIPKTAPTMVFACTSEPCRFSN